MTEHRFHTAEPVEISVQIPSGDIAVETVDGDESLVVLEGDEKLVAGTRVEQRGRSISVELEGRVRVFGLSIGLGDVSFGSGRLHVRVQVPHGSDGRFSTASADVSVRGRLASLDVKSASGDVLVTGEIERSAVVKTVSGDVRLGSVGAELRAQTVSGDVTAGPVGGSVVAKTVSGDVRLESLRAGQASFNSVSGDVEIGIATGSNVDVDAGSVSGTLSSEVPLASEPGPAGEGPTVVLRGKTVSGDFRVFRAA